MAYSFPILSIHQIVSTMARMNIQLSELNIKNPSPEMIEIILKQFLQYILGTVETRDEQIQIPFEYTSSFENPDFHTESLKRRRLFVFAQKLMMVIGVNEFSFSDMYKPDEKRAVRILSGIINFISFKENEISELSPNQDNVALKSNNCHQLEGQKEELLLELNRIINEKKCEDGELEQWNEKMEEEKLELHAKVNQIQQVEAEADQLNKEKREMQNQIANKSFELTLVKEEMQKLKSDRVEKPELLLQEIEVLNSKSKKEKELKDETETNILDYEKRMEYINKVDKEIQNSIGVLKEVTNERLNYKKKSKSIKDSKTEIEKKREEQKNLMLLIERLKNEQNVKEKKQQDVHRLMEKKQSLLSQLENVRMKKKMNEQKIENMSQKVKLFEEKEHDIENLMEKLFIQNEQMKQTAQTKYEKLLLSVRNYNHKLANCMARDWKSV